MNAIHALLMLIIRLWAIFVILTPLSTVFYYLFEMVFAAGSDDPNPKFINAGVLGHHFIWLAAGATAWFAAPAMARVAYKPNIDERLLFNIEAPMLISVGSFLLGFYLLAEHLPALFAGIFSFLMIAPNQSGNLLSGPYVLDSARLISRLVIVIAGCWMAFRPADLAKLFSWLRSVGQYAPEANQPPSETGK